MSIVSSPSPLRVSTIDKGTKNGVSTINKGTKKCRICIYEWHETLWSLASPASHHSRSCSQPNKEKSKGKKALIFPWKICI
ncbi:hypothetical protein L1887_19308 [Cichorium endivia]|nr:hypothetical protein L1887_19308 [Cichorium endivia]